MITVLLALASALTIAEPSDTTEYVVLNHGRPAGEMIVARGGDSVVVHYRHVDRNRGNRSLSTYHLAPDGTMRSAESRQVGLTDGVVADEPIDRFEVVADSVHWTLRGTSGVAHRDSGYYRLRGSVFDQALLVQHLIDRPDGATRLVPSGRARLEIAADTLITTDSGPERVRLALVHGPAGRTPAAVWIDEDDELFASDVGWFITVRRGAEQTLPVLREIEVAYRDAQGEALARELIPAPVTAIAIVDGDVFDAESGTMRPGTTVIVRGDRIVAVGPSDSLEAPSGATVIDAAGKTIVPGLWEMHSHLQLSTQTQAGLVQLARGITTSRDLASDIDVAVSYRDRAARGEIVAPRTILGGFIEGPGNWAGPTEVLVRDEQEAREWVARYDSLGYRQIKLYNLVHPDLVPVIADETHRRGMRLSGHIPRGMSTTAAVELGFDEVNHSAFLLSTFHPDSLFVPSMRAYSAVAVEVAPNVDVEGEHVTRMIELFRDRGTVIDGTFNLWMQDEGDTTAADDDARPEAEIAAARANRNWLRMIRRLHDAGVTLVPGTDAQGSATYVDELELYERAGIPAARVLQMATMIPARVMGDDDEYGSITAGKVADLVIIDGRPAERVGDLRKVERVMLGGRLYEPEALLRAAGRGSGR